MGFLDNTGLAYFASWVKDRLDKKFDKSGGTIGNGAIENLADRNGIEISGYKNGTSDTSLMLDQTKATFSHRIYGDVGPAVVSGVAVPKSDTDAANKAYVDSCKTPVPSGEGELVYVQVTSYSNTNGTISIKDCIVPAWLNLPERLYSGPLRLLAPAVIPRQGVVSLRYLYVHIIGNYKFLGLEPASGGPRINVLTSLPASGGGYFRNYSCPAMVLDGPDNIWDGSAAGDVRILNGYYSSSGSTPEVFYDGDCEILPDFYSSVVRI